MLALLHDHDEGDLDDGTPPPPLGVSPWSAEIRHEVVVGDWFVYAKCNQCGSQNDDFVGALGDVAALAEWMTHGTQHR